MIVSPLLRTTAAAATIAIATAIVADTGHAADAPAATVTISAGTLRGAPAKVEGVAAYKGIPYALAPTGALRWRAPKPAAAWRGVRDATRFGAACPQHPSKSDPVDPVADDPVQSEDCLFLNVWTPAPKVGVKTTAKPVAAPSGKLPVFVWIHGGAFAIGSAALPTYDGASLAKRGIVVVTLNYRLGLLGYLAHPALTAESPRHASGNYALQDQIAGLRWIRDNIAKFGGDPAQVTIAGHSGGGISVGTLMISPQAKGLFARAIVESGPLEGLAPETKSLAAAETVGALWMANRGARTAAQMRALPVAALIKRSPEDKGAVLGPIVDGWTIAAPPADTLVAGGTAKVPLMIGVASGESGSMTAARPTPASVESFGKMVFGADQGAKVLAHYPHATDVEAGASQLILKTDQMLAGSRAEAACHARAGNPTWLYVWDHAPPGPDSAWQRAYHGSELTYVFGTLDAKARPWTDADRSLVNKMQIIWTNFIRTGNPNGTAPVRWPQFDPRTDPAAMGHRMAGHDDPVTPPATIERLDRFFPALDPHPRPIGDTTPPKGCG